MSKTYTVGPATVAMFRMGFQPGGKGPVRKTTYFSTIVIGQDSVQMIGQGPGSEQEIEMIGSFIQTFTDAMSMTKKAFLKAYDLKASAGGPVWDFAKRHQHEILQMRAAFEKGDVTEVS